MRLLDPFDVFLAGIRVLELAPLLLQGSIKPESPPAISARAKACNEDEAYHLLLTAISSWFASMLCSLSNVIGMGSKGTLVCG